MKQNKNIGNLFKDKLASYEDSDINQDWDEMELKLTKLRFFKFSLTNFNIYYCSLVLATFALSSAIFIKTFFLTENSQQDLSSSSYNDLSSKRTGGAGADSIEVDVKPTDQEKNNYGQGNTMAGKNDSKSFSKNKVSILNKKEEEAIWEKKNKKEVNTLDKGNGLDNNNIQSSTNTSGKDVQITVDKTSENISNPSDISTGNNQPGSGITNTVNDNLNIPVPKKKVIYITKQDTVEVFDTLRRKKPYKRK